MIFMKIKWLMVTIKFYLTIIYLLKKGDSSSRPSAKKLKLTAREATWRRRERRERASALRFWEVQLPPPVVGYDLQAMAAMVDGRVRGEDDA